MIQSTAAEDHKSSISHETSEYQPSSALQDTLSDEQRSDDSSSSSSSGGEESKVPIIHTPPPPPTSSSNVVVLQVRDITIYLVGTSHSGNDVDVKALVEELCPYVVMVELCRSRRSVLYYNAREQRQQESKKNNISLMAMAKQCFQRSPSIRSAIVKLFLSFFTQRLSHRLQSMPDFVTAYRAGKSVGSKIVLADRPIEITLLRMFDSLTLNQKFRLLWTLFRSQDPQQDEEVSKTQLDNRDLIKQFVGELGVTSFNRETVLFDERDQYMADQLRECVRLTRRHFRRQSFLERRQDQESSTGSNGVTTPQKRSRWTSRGDENAPSTPTKIVSLSMTESPVRSTPLTFSTPPRASTNEEKNVEQTEQKSQNSAKVEAEKPEQQQTSQRQPQRLDDVEHDTPLQADQMFTESESQDGTTTPDNDDLSYEEKETTKTIVAVVGAAHVKGIVHYLEHPEEVQLDRVMAKPRVNPIQSVLAFIALAIFLIIIFFNAVLFTLRGISAGGFDESLLDTAAGGNMTTSSVNESATN